MIAPSTTTHTLRHKNRVTTWTETVQLTRRPATFSRYRAAVHGSRAGERERARWVQYVLDHLVECFEVEAVTTTGEQFPRTSTERFFEFVTTFGRGIIVDYQDHSEIAVFIPNDGGPALLTGFWRKRGHMVGWARAYAVGMGVNPDSRKKADHCSPLRIYYAVSGRKF